ncbi:MAG: hypothetical protein HN521_06105, partial [Candidatus Latescibacteria bacterium]|nr:hypothetical protein [Candidatus Latescibacterota bacterium]
MARTPTVADVDNPLYKIKTLSVEALRDDELLAIILRTKYNLAEALERAHGVLSTHPLSALLCMQRAELIALNGISAGKADTLSAAFELAKRGLNQGMGILPSITEPSDTLALVTDIKDAKK